MDERIAILPFCTNQELITRDKMRVLCLTDSPHVFNKYRSMPQTFLDRVEYEIGLSDDDDDGVSGKSGFECTLSLECNGVIVASTHEYRDEINNRIITQYARNLFFRALCDEYGYDGCPISMHIHLSYTEYALRLIDRYVDLFLTRSTFKKTKLKNAKTIPSKIEALKEAFSEESLKKTKFIGDSYKDVISDMVFDFAKLKGIVNGKYVDSAWDIAQQDIELYQYISSREANSYNVLCAFLQEQLKAMMFGYSEYVDDSGTKNSHIVSFESGKIFYDMNNKCLYRG